MKKKIIKFHHITYRHRKGRSQYCDCYIFTYGKQKRYLYIGDEIGGNPGTLYLQYDEDYSDDPIQLYIDAIPYDQYIKDLLKEHPIAITIRNQGLK